MIALRAFCICEIGREIENEMREREGEGIREKENKKV
jgi:hypothetical protein